MLSTGLLRHEADSAKLRCDVVVFSTCSPSLFFGESRATITAGDHSKLLCCARVRRTHTSSVSSLPLTYFLPPRSFIHTFGIANLDYQLLQLQSGKFSDFATGYTTTGGPGLTGSRVGHLHDHDHEAAGAIGGAALGAEAIHHHHHDEKRMRGGPVAPGTGRGAKRELFGGRKKGQVAEVSAPVGMTTTTGSGVVA